MPANCRVYHRPYGFIDFKYHPYHIFLDTRDYTRHFGSQRLLWRKKVQACSKGDEEKVLGFTILELRITIIISDIKFRNFYIRTSGLFRLPD